MEIDKETWATGKTRRIVAEVQRCPGCPGGDACPIENLKKALVAESGNGPFSVQDIASNVAGLEYTNFGLGLGKRTWHFECSGVGEEKGKVSVTVERINK